MKSITKAIEYKMYETL